MATTLASLEFRVHRGLSHGWITSSARCSSDCGIVRPSALTVLRLDERRRWGRKDGAGRETVLLVEQNARMALSIASTTYVLKAGTIALEGSSAASACTSERPTWALTGRSGRVRYRDGRAVRPRRGRRFCDIRDGDFT